jgi:polyribonucleotide nucleotidyltransferase
MNNHTFTARLGDKAIIIETGELAQQAGGAVTVRCGDTLLLVTATMSHTLREGIDFFPLTVDFEERLYAAGRIPGSFFRREGRPTESATLTARLADRPLRPLFPSDMRNDVQVIITPLSHDEEHQADILSIIGASAALTISDIPFAGPVGAVRVGHIDGELIINPTVSQMETSKLDLRLAGTADALLMVEAGANEVGEAVMIEALRRGHEALQDVIRVQNEMRSAVGKPKQAYESHELPEEAYHLVYQQVGDRLPEAIYGATGKFDFYERTGALKDELIANNAEAENGAWDEKVLGEAFNQVLRNIIRERTINEGVRADGRDPRTIRQLSAEVG